MVRATGASWKKLKPMPEENTILYNDFLYTLTDMEKIQYGFIPQQMEDHWFMYYEDYKLYIHRSWSGYCIYLVNFVRETENYRLESIIANRSPNEWGATRENEQDRQLVLRLIEFWLIKRAYQPNSSS